MRCPICKKEAPYLGNSHRPFCSDRCKLIDLDNWLSEHYRISTPVEAETLNDQVQPDIADEETEGNRE
jgi:endogenous inhibitor of DNA gyrase (YacG/DUF329 family)